MLTITAVIEAYEQVLANRRQAYPHLDGETLLSDVGLDSLEFAEVLIILEEQMGIEIAPGHFIGSRTINEFFANLTLHTGPAS